MVFGEVDVSLQIHSYILMQVMKLYSVEDPFEILKRNLHPYKIIALWWSKESEFVF